MGIYSLLLIAGVVAIIFTVIGVTGGRKLIHHHVAEGHNDVLVPIFLTAGAIYAVFLAFLVVAVWESYDAAHANIAEEATALSTLYRASTGMDPATGEKLRGLVREYTEQVVKDEWSIQAKAGGASEKARKAGLEMYRLFAHQDAAVRQSDVAIDQAALELIGRIQDDRSKRTLQASESLPPIMWLVSIGSGILLVAMTFLLYMEKGWPHITMASMMATMIAMLLCINLVLAWPFSGLAALSAEPFEHALTVYTSVDSMSSAVGEH